MSIQTELANCNSILYECYFQIDSIPCSHAHWAKSDRCDWGFCIHEMMLTKWIILLLSLGFRRLQQGKFKNLCAQMGRGVTLNHIPENENKLRGRYQDDLCPAFKRGRITEDLLPLVRQIAPFYSTYHSLRILQEEKCVVPFGPLAYWVTTPGML